MRSLPLLLSLAVASSILACGEEPSDVPPAESDVVAAPPAGTDPAPAPGPAAPDATGEGPAEVPAPPPVPELEVHTLANLGDSISQGFGADDAKPLDVNAIRTDETKFYHDNPTLSWVQGSDPRVASVASHYRTLDPKLVVKPFSRSGAELVGDLEGQARQLGKAGVAPDLVYVLLGGNDVCNRAPSTTADPTATLYPIEKWRAAIVKGLDALSQVLGEKATVRFVSMPRVDLLVDQAGAAKVPIVYESPLGRVTGEATCRDLWTVAAQAGHGICKIVTAEPSADRRRAIGARIDRYNDILAEEVRKRAKDMEKNPKGIAFQSDWHGPAGAGGVKDGSGGTFVFEASHVGRLDCFHPSIAGQKALASMVLTKAKWE